MKWPSCSLPYAPPEVALAALTNTANAIVRPSHDIWALGVVAYEAITQVCLSPRHACGH